MACAPPQVILVLRTTREERPQVDEMVQPSLREEVVQESELRRRVSRGGEIFQEGDLHVCAGELHAGVPCELGLLLEEEDFGKRSGGRFGVGVVQGNGDGERGGPETDADKVKEVVW